MGKRITPGLVEKYLTIALKRANKTYCKLSGGEWVSQRGVESFLAYFVAQPFQKFFSSSKACVLLEVSQKDLYDKYLPGVKSPRKRKSKGWSSNRFDVVVLRKDGLKRSALGVVELKRDEFGSGWEKDIKRLASIVMHCRKTKRTNTEFQFGCFAAFVAEESNNDKKVNEWIKMRLKDRWRPFMAATAKRNGIKVRVFKPFEPSFSSDFEPYKWLDHKKNKYVQEGQFRYGVIGCVFYN